ncbi:hypothetical protein D3C80_1243590 [compost metagenome]
MRSDRRKLRLARRSPASHPLGQNGDLRSPRPGADVNAPGDPGCIAWQLCRSWPPGDDYLLQAVGDHGAGAFAGAAAHHGAAFAAPGADQLLGIQRAGSFRARQPLQQFEHRDDAAARVPRRGESAAPGGDRSDPGRGVQPQCRAGCGWANVVAARYR